MGELHPGLLTPKGLLVSAVVGFPMEAVQANRKSAERAQAYVDKRPPPSHNEGGMRPIQGPVSEKAQNDKLRPTPAPLDARTQLEKFARIAPPALPKQEVGGTINFSPLPARFNRPIISPMPTRIM